MTASRAQVPVSVLIPAKNEIANIEECLASVRWAGEVVVVDSHSTDGSAERAAELGARVVPFQWNGQFPKKKNWALENVGWRYDWVLILDADERITPPLAREIAQAVRSDAQDGYYINRRFMFLGGWLRHCGYYPSWNLRLFRHRMGRYERLDDLGDTGSGDNEVHEHIVLKGGRAGFLQHDMLHYAYPTIGEWVEKHNRYSSWEAHVIDSLHTGEDRLKPTPFGGPLERKRWLKRLAMRLPGRPFVRFLYHYVFRQGFRDGRRGFVFCCLMGFYEFLSTAKALELRVARRCPTSKPKS